MQAILSRDARQWYSTNLQDNSIFEALNEYASAGHLSANLYQPKITAEEKLAPMTPGFYLQRKRGLEKAQLTTKELLAKANDILWQVRNGFTLG